VQKLSEPAEQSGTVTFPPSIEHDSITVSKEVPVLKAATFFAFTLALFKLANTIDDSIPMMAMTTRSSMRVNPRTKALLFKNFESRLLVCAKAPPFSKTEGVGFGVGVKLFLENFMIWFNAGMSRFPALSNCSISNNISYCPQLPPTVIICPRRSRSRIWCRHTR